MLEAKCTPGVGSVSAVLVSTPAVMVSTPAVVVSISAVMVSIPAVMVSISAVVVAVPAVVVAVGSSELDSVLSATGSPDNSRFVTNKTVLRVEWETFRHR